LDKALTLTLQKTFDAMVHYPFIHARLTQFRSCIKDRTHDEFHLPGPVWLRIGAQIDVLAEHNQNFCNNRVNSGDIG
jgi:hypothetical protein